MARAADLSNAREASIFSCFSFGSLASAASRLNSRARPMRYSIFFIADFLHRCRKTTVRADGYNNKSISTAGCQEVMQPFETRVPSSCSAFSFAQQTARRRRLRDSGIAFADSDRHPALA
jgi:hypothetical protein